jgi:hypothetical protein
MTAVSSEMQIDSKSNSRAAWMIAGAGLAICFALLLWQTWYFRFMSDDAYIAFRYARNLSEGHGLVFNPGYERVEGYTCFLWVLLLAGFDSIGLDPPLVANWISAILGAALWALVIAYCWRSMPAQGRPWLMIVPALWLASNRGYAMWCTGGLETKLYEILIVGGVLLNATDAQVEKRRWWPGALLLALASLTRPDALLVSAMVFGARALHEISTGGFRLKPAILGAAIYLGIVGAHFAFRLAYYGAWFPNTYYAKLDAQSWWDLGLVYFAAFGLEYAAVVWLPLAIIGAIAYVRASKAIVPLLFAAAVVPHAIYIAFAGGDNFEYRPINLYLPFFAILIYAGVRDVVEQWRLPILGAAWGLAACAAAAFIPVLTHIDFPPVLYRPGFPGISVRLDGSKELVSSERHLDLFAIPGLREYLNLYNRVYAKLTSHFGGLRQEEQVLHLATVIADGKRLAALIDQGVLPRDTHIATRSVGAIPYLTDLRTLDILGLTDAHVAHGPMAPNERRMIAHGKNASMDYMREQGVEVIAIVTTFMTNDPVEIDYARQLAAKMKADRLEGEVLISKPLVDGRRFHGIFLMSLAEANEKFPAMGLHPAEEMPPTTKPR